MNIRVNGRTYEVWLGDDGTLDTLITVNGQEFRFDGEYASQYRTRDGAMTARGLRALALECVEDLDEEEAG